MDFVRFIPSLKVSLEETVSQRLKLRDVESNTLAEIGRRSEEIHKAVDELRYRMQDEVKTIINDEINRLAGHENELKKWIVWLEAKRELNTSDKISMDPDDSLHESFLATLHCLTQFEHTLLQFKSGTEMDNLADIYGSIDHYTVSLPFCKFTGPLKPYAIISPKLFSKFQCSEQGNVHAIAPISNSKAWICSGWGNKTIALYTSEGQRKMSVSLDMPVDHMVLMEKGDILISGYKEKTIKRLDEHLKLSTFAQLNFIPRGMTVSDSGEIFICGLKRNPSSVSSKESEYDERSHIIAKYSADGKFISEVVISPHDPHRVSISHDGKFCFSYLSRNSRRQVMIMDQTGNPEKIYSGNDPDGEHTFYPLGTVCDRYGHILVADWNNDCVHLLDKSGSFMQYLVSENDGLESPSALALDRSGNMWVGNAVGCIRVYKYIT